MIDWSGGRPPALREAHRLSERPAAFGLLISLSYEEILMDQLFYVCIAGLIAVFLAAAFILARFKLKSSAKRPPEFCMGAIRVTDRQGRDMLIIRKDDGSFEMHEEQQIRKQCVP
jgi:hypothetical protein